MPWGWVRIWQRCFMESSLVVDSCVGMANGPTCRATWVKKQKTSDLTFSIIKPNKLGFSASNHHLSYGSTSPFPQISLRNKDRCLKSGQNSSVHGAQPFTHHKTSSGANRLSQLSQDIIPWPFPAAGVEPRGVHPTIGPLGGTIPFPALGPHLLEMLGCFGQGSHTCTT